MSVAATFPTSPSALRSRCEEVLRDLTETQQGLGKEWKNVQPCVARAAQLLLQQAQHHEGRLAALEDKVDQVLRAVEVIASDTRLKERRYHMDRDATDRVLEALQQRSQQLHDAMETERRATQHLHEQVLYPGLDYLQQQIDRLASGAPPPSTTTFTAANDDSALKEMVREVKLLRSQWQQLLQSNSSVPPTPAQLWEEPRASSAARRRRMPPPSSSSPPAVKAVAARSPVDCSVARWHWRGGHVSSPMLSADSPIPWGSPHVRNTMTGEWLPVPGAAATHAELCEGVGLPFVWRLRRPAVVELLKDGIYRVTTCLLTSCSRCVGGKSQGGGHKIAASVLPSVTLRVNNNTVFSFLSGGSTCYTLQPAAGSGRQSSTGPRHAAAAAAAPSVGGNCSGVSCPRRPCNCSTTIASSASTFAEYFRLSAGSTVSVHCHEAPDTNVMHEAFLEMELIAA
ncbi:hypothetical protein DQ04_00501020 [Trypanosoma grayi]|uniref:hypothetical protein n=1 Tax=Trypanosoma grayi TaxID=71804 RepID=UPI0004F4434F|nr:hypothetical protein DQ04_00501020 [Trypanosoma grayi]KEG14362.1 hypothetical protein DQ04_00501020 [Trypanosoma grayi]